MMNNAAAKLPHQRIAPRPGLPIAKPPAHMASRMGDSKLEPAQQKALQSKLGALIRELNKCGLMSQLSSPLKLIEQEINNA